MKKIYIAGPMSGLQNFNRDAFNCAAYGVLMDGNIPLNPAAIQMGLPSANTCSFAAQW